MGELLWYVYEHLALYFNLTHLCSQKYTCHIVRCENYQCKWFISICSMLTSKMRNNIISHNKWIFNPPWKNVQGTFLNPNIRTCLHNKFWIFSFLTMQTFGQYNYWHFIQLNDWLFNCQHFWWPNDWSSDSCWMRWSRESSTTMTWSGSTICTLRNNCYYTSYIQLLYNILIWAMFIIKMAE